MIFDTHKKWPSSDLEEVVCCPFCGSNKRTLIYQAVRDYSFFTAPGEWNYWDCRSCKSLYLNPRPTKFSVGKAYSNYYTHLVDNRSMIKRLKIRLKHECLSQWLGINLVPRLRLSKFIGYLLLPLKSLIRIPYEIEFLATNPRGSLIDVGCGGGVTLGLAKQMGWAVKGLELDPLACQAANNIGLNVVQGDYNKLSEINEKFDCVLCSHVLEHVHDPIEMLNLLTDSLKENGHLILSLPNARSDLRFHFGKFWRGLEAPRHMSIPTVDFLISMLKTLGYTNIKQYDLYEETYWQSLCIERKENLLPQKNFLLFKLGRLLKGKKFTQTTDYIQLIAKKT